MKRFSITERTSAIDVNEREVKYNLCDWFDTLKYDYGVFQIHDVEVKTKDETSEIEVTIYLGRPGSLIGKAGRTIDELVKFLSFRLGRTIKVNLFEHDWKH